jgi:hypothetical protein
MYNKEFVHKKKGSKPIEHNNNTLQRHILLLHIQNSGVTNGNLLFVSVRRACLGCVYI